MLDFCIHASKGTVIIMNRLKSIYNNPFKDSNSRPIHTSFLIVASSGPPVFSSAIPHGVSLFDQTKSKEQTFNTQLNTNPS